MKETFQITAHQPHDPAFEWRADMKAKVTKIPKSALRDFFYFNPLYEVLYDVEYDHDTGKFKIVAAHSNGWTLVRDETPIEDETYAD